MQVIKSTFALDKVPGAVVPPLAGGRVWGPLRDSWLSSTQNPPTSTPCGMQPQDPPRHLVVEPLGRKWASYWKVRSLEGLEMQNCVQRDRGCVGDKASKSEGQGPGQRQGGLGAAGTGLPKPT